MFIKGIKNLVVPYLNNINLVRPYLSIFKYNCVMHSVRASLGCLILRADSTLSSRLTLICQFYKDTSTIPEGIWGFFTSPSCRENRQLLTSAVVKPTYGQTCRNPVISRHVLVLLRTIPISTCFYLPSHAAVIRKAIIPKFLITRNF